MDDELLPVLLKLVQGNKELCFELIKTVREQHPDKPMHWCIQKAIYDARFPKKQVKANSTLARWGVGGGNFPATASPPTQPTSAPRAQAKPLPPPPNPALSKPTLSKPKTESWGWKGLQLQTTQDRPLALSQGDLEALLKAKRQMAQSQPSSAVSRKRLFRLCHGDVDQARRLVQRIRVANPDQSEQWAVDKAIYDLERDRH